MKISVSKKLVSIMLICIMIVPMLMFGTLNAMADSAVLYRCSFDDVVTSDDPDTPAQENKATATVLNTLGWNGQWNNTSIGEFGHDDETNRNYLSPYDTYSAKRTFDINNGNVIASGKIYLSFSYKRPSGGTGNVYLRVLGDTVEDKIQVADLSSLGNTLGLRSSMGSESSVTVGDFSDNKWHEVGFLFDLDSKVYTGYVDGVATATSASFPYDTLGGIKGLGLGVNDTNKPKCYVTDFLVKKVTGTNEITANTEVGETDIKVTFSEPLGTVINASNVNVGLCGSDSKLTVKNVKQAGSTLDISYEGTPVAGREYRITYGDVKTVFGNDVAPVYFYIPAAPTATGLSASVSPSAVNANGIIDFENVTSEPAASGTKFAPSKVTSPTDFYTYVGTKNTDKANSQVVSLTTIGVTNGNTSGYALQLKSGGQGLAFGEKLVQNDTRTVVYEFKYLYKKASGNGAKVNLALMNPDGANGVTGRIVEIPVDATAWHTMKVVYDRVTPKIDVYKDNELLGSYTTCYNTASATNVNIPSYAWRIGADGMNAPTAEIEFYIDDFKQSYVTDCAGVESVRYVDINNKKSGLDTITPATKAIEIKFSENMTESTLSAINVNNGVVTDRSYNPATYTYTLELDNLLAGNKAYTLTVPNTVTAVSGAKLAETVYNFSTTAGEFKMTNLKIETEGDELANVSAVAGTAITVKTDMINTLGKAGNVTLIYSFYDDDKLVDVNYDTIPLTNGMDTLVSKTFTVKSGITPDSAKAFVWYGSIDALEPIIPATEY